MSVETTVAAPPRAVASGRDRGLAVLVLLRMVAVPIAPLLSNDSIGYLRRAQDLTSQGWVEQGYRQIGYPLWQFLAGASRLLSGWDRLFGIALGQRAALAAGAVGLLWVHRLWALPILIYLTSETIVALSGLLITEGITLGLSAILGTFLGRVAIGGPDAARTLSSETRTAYLVISALIIVLLASIKLQFAAALLPFAAVAFDQRVHPAPLRHRMAIVAIPLLFVSALGITQAFENQAELGVFEPVSERARASWYGAWQAVFVTDPDNHDDQALAKWWDDGNLYRFLHGLEAREPDYSARSAIIDRRIAEMFDAAGTTPTRERLEAFAGAIVGGRTDDVAHLVDRLATTAPSELPNLLTSNNLGRREGAEGIEQALNGGNDTQAVVAQPLRSVLSPLPSDHANFKEVFTAATIFILMAAIWLVPSRRFFALSVLGSHIVTAAAVATSYIDNARYMVGSTVLMGSLATVLLPECWLAVRLFFTESLAHGEK